MVSNQLIKLMNFMPKGLVVYLSKKIVNHYLAKYATIHVSGQEKLKKIKEPTIFICNHLSNADGLVLNHVLKDIDPTFVAGVKLSSNTRTNIGLNVVKSTHIKPNSADAAGLKNIIRLIKAGESILIFPEGTRSRSGQMIEAKAGITLIANMSKAPIVPIGIYGTEKLLPINNAGDMSAEKFHHAHVYINIGDQFECPKRDKTMDKKDYTTNTTKYLMERISELLLEDYQGVYRSKG